VRRRADKNKKRREGGRGISCEETGWGCNAIAAWNQAEN
jgi:hypothetical protein